MAELEQLPAVDGPDARHQRAASAGSAGAGTGGGAVALGEREEQVLQGDRLRGHRPNQRPGLHQGLGQDAGGGLVGGERDPPVIRAHIGDPGLGPAYRQRPVVVGGLEPVSGPGTALELRYLPLVDDPSRAHDRDPVADVLHLGQQMAGQQHGHAVLGQTPDQQPHVPHAGGIEAGRRFVEQQQLGIAQQCRGDPQALAHAMRVAADAVTLAAGQLHGLQRLIDPVARAPAVVGGEHLQVAPRVEVRIEGRRLDEAGDPLQRLHALDRVATEQAHRALGRPDQPQHHPQRRRLAGAVGAQIAVHVAGSDRQVDAPDGGQLAVALDQPAHLNRRRRGVDRSRRRAAGRVIRGRAHRVKARAAWSAAYGMTEPITV